MLIWKGFGHEIAKGSQSSRGVGEVFVQIDGISQGL